MKKYLIKLNEDVRLVKEIKQGDIFFLDEAGKFPVFSEQPDYMLEIYETDIFEDMPFTASFYPKYLEKYKNLWWVNYYKHSVDIQEILFEIERDENREILSYNEIQN